MVRTWGEARSRWNYIRGLRTCYEKGFVSVATLVKTLRREADALDRHNAPALLHDGPDARRAKDYRREANELERTQHTPTRDASS